MPRLLTRMAPVLAVTTLMSACTVRYASTSHADPVLDDSKGIAVEGGLYFWDGTVRGQRGDVGLMGAYQRFDLFTDAAASQVAARGRWFPMVDPGERMFDPFLGGGIGVYRLNRTETVLTCRGRGICLSDQTEQRGQATGLSAHLVGGTEVRLGTAPAGLVFAVTRELGGFDAEWNLNSWRFSAGLTYRPGN